ncbi:MAG: hypothetical protein R3E68_14280, partial [Burkholderiaceae bacterium]
MLPIPPLRLTPRPPARPLLVALASALLLIGGCGGDDDPVVSSDGPPAGNGSPPPAPSVTGTALIRALNETVDAKATAPVAATVNQGGNGPADYAFSGNRFFHSQGEYCTQTSLTPLGSATEQGLATLRLDRATDGASAFTFSGNGTLDLPGGARQLGAGQVSISGPIPLGQTLITYTLPASPGASVALAVRQVAQDDTAFSLCWSYDLPELQRESCMRHRLADGSPVSLESTDTVGATTYTHQALEHGGLHRTVLKCRRTDTEYPGTSLMTETTHDYHSISVFDPSDAWGGFFDGDDPTGQTHGTVEQ